MSKLAEPKPPAPEGATLYRVEGGWYVETAGGRLGPFKRAMDALCALTETLEPVDRDM